LWFQRCIDLGDRGKHTPRRGEKPRQCHGNDTNVWQMPEPTVAKMPINTAMAVPQYLGHHKCQGSEQET